VTSHVDVVVCTYNSAKFLRACLASIKRNIPFKTIWVVDNHSSDDTVKIAESFGASVVRTRGSLAESRQLSFKLVETRIFANVDSDVILCEDWFDKLNPYLSQKNVGACWGIALNMNPIQLRHYQQAMYSFKNPSLYNLIVLGNMLAKKEAVEGLCFPEGFKLGAVAGEDYYIKHFIEAKGYKTLTVPIFVEHYCNPSPLGCKTFWMGASTRLTQRKGLMALLEHAFLAVPQAAFVVVKTRDVLVFPVWIRYRFENVYGWLHWDKYYNLKRKGSGEVLSLGEAVEMLGKK
jgi:glycosyltransferase involved in cell wall biosynthesis